MYSFKNNKVNIFTPKGHKPVFIGEINPKEDTLYVRDRDNFHPGTKSLGIDSEILAEAAIPFKYLVFRYYKNKLITTRKFFWDHRLITDKDVLRNGRVMSFLPMGLFGVEQALAYENSLKKERENVLDQMDIFEIGKIEDETGSRMLDIYLKNLIKKSKGAKS